ncbi:uncharacterized protein LOC126316757 [Schistocerca gregaria]|uniref:uncharacterized protein LOC126316757 n=1 Tax=Schistocerca gregaria TaxID=7010 RepID=UPI00211DC770|nr:uncharacterized protein LOC126316757 [Schistocerca gregaria]
MDKPATESEHSDSVNATSSSNENEGGTASESSIEPSSSKKTTETQTPPNISSPPSSSYIPPIGSQYGLQKILVPLTISLYGIFILSFLLIGLTRRYPIRFCSYRVAILSSSLFHAILLVFSILQDTSGNIPIRILANEDAHMLLFNLVFWISRLSMWPTLFIPLIYGLIQTSDLVTQIPKTFNTRFPPQVSSVTSKILRNRDCVLKRTALAEPLILVVLIFSIFKNGISAILLYFLWINVRYAYSAYTRSSVLWWTEHADRRIGSHPQAAPYYRKFKCAVKSSHIGRFLPGKQD